MKDCMGLNVIMLGPPGAGKGTQAERFARAQGVPKISTGEILREAVHSGTSLGRLAMKTMDEGRLVGDDVMIAIVRDRLSQPDAQQGFVLDGFPRTVAQAEALDRMLAGREPLIVVEIRVPEEELVRRLRGRRVCGECGLAEPAVDGQQCPRCGGPWVQRSDDDEAVVRARLKVYDKDTEPVVEYYRGRPTFQRVNGYQPSAFVAAEMDAAIEAARLTRVQERRS
jgi:adenylate kinase